MRSFVVQIQSGQTYKKIPSGNATFDISPASLGGRCVRGGSMCVGYNRQNEQLTFAYATELTSRNAAAYAVETTPNAVALSASDGRTLADPLAVEMNSYDAFGQNVTLVDVKYSAGSLVLKSVKDYNTNADIAYIPVYPGYEHEFVMPSCYGVMDKDLECRTLSDEYYSVELLGQSRDITRYIDLVNPSPDPYFDYDKIRNDYEFGRVYEDYEKELENTFTQIKNPSISRNSARRYGSYNVIRSVGSSFVWTVNLNAINSKPFTVRDLQKM